PDPPPNSIFENIMAPFPQVTEAIQPAGTTAITYGGAIRAALDHIIRGKNARYREQWCTPVYRRS
ncbi:MAG: hypothetical protein QGH72_04195, partial [Dehalococcoidia bacterium]|nr:hypothetical protein [Dehalococcoidia bacterium]